MIEYMKVSDAKTAHEPFLELAAYCVANLSAGAIKRLCR